MERLSHDHPLYLEKRAQMKKCQEGNRTTELIRDAVFQIYENPERYGYNGIYKLEVHADGTIHKYNAHTMEYKGPLDTSHLGF